MCACVFITPHVHGANRSHSHPLSSVQSEHLVKLKSWVFTEEKRKQKQPLCFLSTEGLCMPFRMGHKQVLYPAGVLAGVTLGCPWPCPPRWPAADPSCCQSLLSDKHLALLTCFSLTSFLGCTCKEEERRYQWRMHQDIQHAVHWITPKVQIN